MDAGLRSKAGAACRSAGAAYRSLVEKRESKPARKLVIPYERERSMSERSLIGRRRLPDGEPLEDGLRAGGVNAACGESCLASPPQVISYTERAPSNRASTHQPPLAESVGGLTGERPSRVRASSFFGSRAWSWVSCSLEPSSARRVSGFSSATALGTFRRASKSRLVSCRERCSALSGCFSPS